MALTQISTGMLASGDGTVDLNIDNGTFVVDVSTSRVGIGAAPTDGTLHVQTASAGTVAASTQADDIVIENNAEGGMTIITPDDQSARIRFTSPSTNNDVGGAHIFYRQNINKMNIGTTVSGGKMAILSGAGNETMLLDGSGNVGIGTSSTYNMRTTIAGAGTALSTGTGSYAVASIYDTATAATGTGGGLAFQGDDGTNSAVTFATVNGSKENATSGNYASYLGFSTRANGAQLTEKMRIASDGKVGIGTDSPTAGLTVSDDTGGDDANFRRVTIKSAIHGVNSGFRFDSESANGTARGGGYYFQPGDTDATTYLGLTASDAAYQMVVTRDGNVGIGNNNPSAFNSLAGKHVVIGSGAEANTLTLFSDDTNDGNGYGHVAFADSNVSSSTAQYAGLIQYFHGDNSMRFYTGGLLRGRIDSAGAIISEKTSGIFFKNSSGGSNSTQIQISNGGGDMRVGVESSSGGALQTGTSAYAAVFGNQANYPTQLTTNGTTRMTINADGIVVHNGVSTYSNAMYMVNNVAYTFDVPVGNEGGSGNVIEVHAMYDHYFNFGYGASLITLVGKRGVSVSRSDIKAITTANGGSWTISAPNSSTLRLTKTAGTYPGAGYGHIMVRFRKP